jgi:hypothetical protein
MTTRSNLHSALAKDHVGVLARGKKTISANLRSAPYAETFVAPFFRNRAYTGVRSSVGRQASSSGTRRRLLSGASGECEAEQVAAPVQDVPATMSLSDLAHRGQRVSRNVRSSDRSAASASRSWDSSVLFFTTFLRSSIAVSSLSLSKWSLLNSRSKSER